MNRRWIVDLVGISFLLGVVGGLCGCGSNKETQTMSAAPVIKEDMARNAPEAPSFMMELSDLRAAAPGGELTVQVKYRVTKGEPNADQPYTCVVAFMSSGTPVGAPIALVEKQGKDLGKEGTLEGTCKVPQGSPNVFVVRVIDGRPPAPRSGGIGPRGGGGGMPKDVSNQLPSQMPAG